MLKLLQMLEHLGPAAMDLSQWDQLMKQLNVFSIYIEQNFMEEWSLLKGYVKFLMVLWENTEFCFLPKSIIFNYYEIFSNFDCADWYTRFTIFCIFLFRIRMIQNFGLTLNLSICCSLFLVNYFYSVVFHFILWCIIIIS